MNRRVVLRFAAVGVGCVFLSAFAASRVSRAQSSPSTTWKVSIVIPPKLVAGQEATVAILGVDGRLAEGITVDFGEDQRRKTDSSGRATFTVPTGVRFVIANSLGS
jgi:hypothetical protein